MDVMCVATRIHAATMSSVLASAANRPIRRRLRFLTTARRQSQSLHQAGSGFQLVIPILNFLSAYRYIISIADDAGPQISVPPPTRVLVEGAWMLACSVCPQRFPSHSKYLIHERTHTGEKPFKCSECSFAAIEAGHLKRHVRIHTGVKSFKCSECSYATSDASNLKTHLRTHNGEKPFTCCECS
jgi:hypothetical protein